MPKQALILLSQGCEETEAVTVIDLLTRAAVSVTYASITEQKEITCSRGVVILAQKTFSQIKDIDFDVVILPGGLKGAENFRDSSQVIEKLKATHEKGGIVAAICASPAFVLHHHNLFPKALMTGYPGSGKNIPLWKDQRVYFDQENRVLTSQGPGTSIDFALKIIDTLLGKEKAAAIAEQLVLPVGIYNYK